MSTSSYSASLRFRAASSTPLATSADFRFGRVLPVMIPTLSIGDSFRANVALILRGLCGGVSPGGRAELLDQLDERRALLLGEAARGQIHDRLVKGEYPGRLLFAGGRQPNDASPSIGRVGLARDQAARLESIHSGGDRSARELDSTANLIYGLRSFVEQHLQDGEV